jgi:hypothetical protein
MKDPNPDWYDWHDRYQLEAGSRLVRRLAEGPGGGMVTVIRGDAGNRRSVPTDLTPRIRQPFADLGFTEIDFVNPDGDKLTVGTQRFDGTPEPFIADRHLFDFVGYATMIERGE